MISQRASFTIYATIEVVIGLSRSGPARQDLRNVSGPEGSSTKELLLGVADQPDLGNPMASSVLFLVVSRQLSVVSFIEKPHPIAARR